MPTALSLLAFPSRWDGAAISMRLLVLPVGNPLQPLQPGQPAFADATLELQAQLIPTLERLPRFADVTATVPLAITAPPASPRQLFARFDESMTIVVPTAATATPRRSGRAIKKLLTPSYRRATGFAAPRTPFAVTDDSYECALNCGTTAPPPGAPRPVNDWTWGRVIALALRQPKLAMRLGLLYELTVQPPAADTYRDGGWLFVTLAPGSDFAGLAGTPSVQSYAARLPALTDARALFARVLFPILATPPMVSYDELIAEAQAYDDGFARLVHAEQPFSANLLAREPDDTLPSHEFGIRLGWDDEDLLVDLNRQISADPDVANLNAPMGAARYRVDVRAAGTEQWFSLNRAQGELATPQVNLGRFDGELAIEVAPMQPQGLRDGDYWLPAYFTRWTGRSLVLSDPDAWELMAQSPPRASSLQPVDDRRVPLRYGERYEFRVRLVDLAGSGPATDDAPVNRAPAPVAAVHFRRFIPPGAVRAEPVVPAGGSVSAPTTYRVFRPRLGYPEAVFTGRFTAADLNADKPAAALDRRPPSAPDPDVATLRVVVEVRGLEFDSANDSPRAGPYFVLYETTRPFPADPTQPLELELAFEDAPVLTGFPAPDAGAIALPSGRDLRLWVSPVCREDAALAYFGDPRARLGRAVSIETRNESADERGLLVQDRSGPMVRGIFLQPDPAPSTQLLTEQAMRGDADSAPSDALGRFAQELDLQVHDVSFTARAGERIVLGCTKGLAHTLSPDHGKLTLGARSALTGQWIVALAARIARDWSWRMLQDTSFMVQRTIERDGALPVTEVVGTLELRAMVSASTQQRPQRDFTRLLFLDAIDPRPAGSAFPRPIRVSYRLTPAFTQNPAQHDPVGALEMLLPVTVAPRQVPKIASAGIALSPYRHSARYDSTEARRKRLWIEFEEPIEDAHDALFCRVLAASPDPMLMPGRGAVDDPLEPPLSIPAEPIRVIVPGASDDQVGLGAMQRLEPGDSDRHFVLPLPPGVEPESSELFGLFTYEFRIGHVVDWSTAQGRFGRPQRVSGLQHPAPTLRCAAQRRRDGITVSAPYAMPVYQGVEQTPVPPNTELWALLYTQVAQVDDRGYRNVLLARRRATPRRADRFFVVDRGEGPARRRQQGAAGVTTAAAGAAFTGFTILGSSHGGPTMGDAHFGELEIRDALEALGLEANAPLGVLTVELLPEEQRMPDPLGAQLGQVRILRTSPLIPVNGICAPCEGA